LRAGELLMIRLNCK